MTTDVPFVAGFGFLVCCDAYIHDSIFNIHDSIFTCLVGADALCLGLAALVVGLFGPLENSK